MQNLNIEKKYYRPKEAKELLSVSLATIWNYIKDGKLKTVKPSSRVTLIHIDEINSLFNDNSKESI